MRRRGATARPSAAQSGPSPNDPLGFAQGHLGARRVRDGEIRAGQVEQRGHRQPRRGMARQRANELRLNEQRSRVIAVAPVGRHSRVDREHAERRQDVLVLRGEQSAEPFVGRARGGIPIASSHLR